MMNLPRLTSLLSALTKHAELIANLRNAREDDFPTEAQMLLSARAISIIERIPMVVGLQLNDITGASKWGYCPLTAIGPAFVLDVRHLIVKDEVVAIQYNTTLDRTVIGKGDGSNVTEVTAAQDDEPESDDTMVRLNSRELAQVLASLRYWQRLVCSSGYLAGAAPSMEAAHFDEVTDDGGPMSADEIDDLCESINCGEADQDVQQDARDAIDNIERAFADLSGSREHRAACNHLRRVLGIPESMADLPPARLPNGPTHESAVVALVAYADAHHEAGSWRSGEDEPFETLHARVVDATRRVESVIGLPSGAIDSLGLVRAVVTVEGQPS